MTIFDSIRYPISSPPTTAEIRALPIVVQKYLHDRIVIHEEILSNWSEKYSVYFKANPNPDNIDWVLRAADSEPVASIISEVRKMIKDLP